MQTATTTVAPSREASNYKSMVRSAVNAQASADSVDSHYVGALDNTRKVNGSPEMGPQTISIAARATTHASPQSKLPTGFTDHPTTSNQPEPIEECRPGCSSTPPTHPPVPATTSTQKASTAKKVTRKRKGNGWSRAKRKSANTKLSNNEMVMIDNTDSKTKQIGQRPVKPLTHAAKQANNVADAFQEPDAGMRKNKGKAKAKQLPSTEEAETGSKRARDGEGLASEDIVEVPVDPISSLTKERRVRRRMYPSPNVDALSRGQERGTSRPHHHIAAPAELFQTRETKRKLQSFDIENQKATRSIAKRLRMDESASQPSLANQIRGKTTCSPSPTRCTMAASSAVNFYNRQHTPDINDMVPNQIQSVIDVDGRKPSAEMSKRSRASDPAQIVPHVPIAGRSESPLHLGWSRERQSSSDNRHKDKQKVDSQKPLSPSWLPPKWRRKRRLR